MEVGTRRERADFAHHVVHECEGLLLVGTERAEADLRPAVLCRRSHPATQLRIRLERGVDVGRHVDLRHDHDVPVLRIAHEVRELVLRVVAAGTAAHLAEATDLRQLGPRLDLDAPALVVGEVQVQHVDLVEREHVDVLLHFARGEKVARHVEHRAAPREARMIRDGDGGNLPRPGIYDLRFDLRRQELAQRLDAVKHARGCGADDAHRVTRHRQVVTLGAERAAVGRHAQRDVPRGAR